MRAKIYIIVGIVLSVFITGHQEVGGQTCYFAGVPDDQPGTFGSPSSNVSWNPNYGGNISICAPKTVELGIEFEGVDYGINGFIFTADTNRIYVYYDWGDGTIEIIKAHWINPAATMKFQPIWKATRTHTYPIGDDECVYRIDAYLYFNGSIGICTETAISKVMTVWDTDNYKGGNVDIGEQVSGDATVMICRNDDSTVTFRDQSIFNCNDDVTFEGSPITNPK